MISITTCFVHRWSLFFSSLVIRNGSIMRRRLCSPYIGHGLFGALLFAGYWNKRLGIIGALGSCFAFIATTTIIPFMPDGWAASAGGFPAMTEKVAFLMKDVVLFAVSVYLLRQDVIRASLFKTATSDSRTTVRQDAGPTGEVAGCWCSRSSGGMSVSGRPLVV